MTRRATTTLLLALAAAGALLLYYLLATPRDASMLLLNGDIYTLNERAPRATALAIRGDRIVAVGTDAEIRSRFRAEQVIDCGGKPVYPGFIDAHAHMESLGASLMNLDVGGAASEDAAAGIVSRAVADTSPGAWIRGRGWDQNRWPQKAFPTRASLDRASPRSPVILTRVDGHALWVNSRALAIAGINRSTPDPAGGRIIRDAAGDPTGVVVDNAVDLVVAAIPPPTTAERTEAIRRAVATCVAAGLTEVQDMGVDSAGLSIYRSLVAGGRFPFRVYAAVLGSSKETWERARAEGPLVDVGGGRLTVRAVKFYADGALGSRGAALVEQYSDDPGNRGLTLTSRDELERGALEAIDAGFQVCTHAIGDRANAFVLDAYDSALTRRGRRGEDLRFRIEHAQVLAPRDIPRFHALGIIPSMQPSHCTSDMPWAPARLGEDRLRGAYAWRSLLSSGCIIPAGSDFPVESPNPLRGFYAAITRQDRSGYPPGGWNPAQRMTRDEALKAYTLWGAYAAFQENEKGSIEPGKWADIVVLTDDIMTIEPPKILTTGVVMTLVAGEVVYRAPAPGDGAR
ncbi:MAG TPA: amidohydrolase [Bacteroidota bacterium]|nr:amidohydrolase [Bacteroidota bacterium]